MKKGDVIKATLKKVRFHKEERMMQGATSGIYDSSYVGDLNEYPNGIVILDDYAKTKHPDWMNKNDNRALTIETELKGETLDIVVTDLYEGDDQFQGVLKLGD